MIAPGTVIPDGMVLLTLLPTELFGPPVVVVDYLHDGLHWITDAPEPHCAADPEYMTWFLIRGMVRDIAEGIAHSGRPIPDELRWLHRDLCPFPLPPAPDTPVVPQ